MKNYIGLIIVIFITLNCAFGFGSGMDESIGAIDRAQTALKSKSFSLDDCVEIGLTNYKSAQVALEQVRLAQLKVRQAKRNLYPDMVGEWQSTTGETITDPYESLSYGVQLEQTIYDGGKLKYGVRQEELGLEIAKRNYQNVRDEIIFEINKAYYNLIRAKMFFNKHKGLIKTAKNDLDLANRLYQADLITKGELLNVESLYHRIEYQSSSFENELSLARLALQQLLNVDSEVRIRDSFNSTETKEIELSLEECIDIALEKRPEIIIGQIAIDSARYGEKIADREGWPKLSMVTSYGRSGEAYSSGDISLANEWSIIGKVSWFFGGNSIEYSNTKEEATAENIVETTRKTEANTRSVKFSLWDKDALASITSKKEADIIYQGSLSEIDKTKNTVRSEVEKAYLSIKSALLSIDSAKRSIEFRKKELEIVKARSNLEELPLSDLLEARMQLNEEETNYINSLANYYLSYATLKQATAYAVLI